MIDLNAVLNAAFAQAAEAHMTELKQMYANNMGILATKIAELQASIQNIHEGNLSEKLQLKIKEISTETVEEAVESHEQNYDHDEFITTDLDLSQYIDVDSEVRDAIRNLSFEVTVN